MELDLTAYGAALTLARRPTILFDWDALKHPRLLNGRFKNVEIEDGMLGTVFSRKVRELPDNTQDLHTERGPKGGWQYTEERAALHKHLVAAYIGQHAKQDRPHVLFTAGGAGSGKTTALEQLKLAPPDEVHIDPDEIKEQLPEYRRLVEEGDPRAASLVHDESIDIAAQLYAAARKGRYNIVMDGTGASPLFMERLKKALDAEYEVQVAYFNTDVDTALARIAERKKDTGRGVNEQVARDMHRNASRIFNDVYESGVAVRVFDTTKKKPKEIASAEAGADIELHDEDAFNTFLEKANVKPTWHKPAPTTPLTGPKSKLGDPWTVAKPTAAQKVKMLQQQGKLPL